MDVDVAVDGKVGSVITWTGTVPASCIGKDVGDPPPFLFRPLCCCCCNGMFLFRV